MNTPFSVSGPRRPGDGGPDQTIPSERPVDPVPEEIPTRPEVEMPSRPDEIPDQAPREIPEVRSPNENDFEHD